MKFLHALFPLAILAASACTPTAAPTPGASAGPSAGPTASTALAVDAEGCEHMQEGPSQAVEANLPSMSRTPATIKPGHQRWDVSLLAEGGARQGTLTLENDKAGDVAIYLNKDLPLVLRQSGQADPVPFKSVVKAVDACTAVKARYVATLGVGVYWVDLGPHTEASVNMVVEPVSDAAH